MNCLKGVCLACRLLAVLHTRFFMHGFFSPKNIHLSSFSKSLRRLPNRISREKRRKANIRQPQIKLQNPIQPQPASPMRRAPIPKCIRIMPEPLTLRVQRGIAFAHGVAELAVVVDALSAGHDFLATHEEVVGI